MIYDENVNTFVDYKKLLKAHAYFLIEVSENLKKYQEDPKNEDEILFYFLKNKENAFIKEQLDNFKKIYSNRNCENTFKISIIGINCLNSINFNYKLELKIANFEFVFIGDELSKKSLENNIKIIDRSETKTKFPGISPIFWSLKDKVLLEHTEFDGDLNFKGVYDKKIILGSFENLLINIEKIKEWIFSEKPFLFVDEKTKMGRLFIYQNNKLNDFFYYPDFFNKNNKYLENFNFLNVEDADKWFIEHVHYF